MKATSNVKVFNAQLAKLAELVPLRAQTIKRYIALDLFNQIVLGNPVRTGWSRANWHIANSTPDTSVSEKPAAGSVMPPPTPDMGELHAINLEDPAYVTNSISYIKFLEEGTVKMPPRHFIKRAIQVVSSRTRDYINRSEQEVKAR